MVVHGHEGQTRSSGDPQGLVVGRERGMSPEGSVISCLDAGGFVEGIVSEQPSGSAGVSPREEGLEAAVDRKKQVRPSVERMFDGEKEARLIAVACGAKPPGRTRWTLELLAERMVALKIVDRCSPQTIMRTLKKTS